MKNFFKKLTPIAIVLIIAIVIIIVARECRHIPQPVETHTTDTVKVTEYVYDTTEIVKYITRPGIKETIYVEVPVDINVTDVVNDYYTMKVYNPIYMDDTSAYIAIEDTVFKNELYTSKLTFVNRRPTAINSTTYITQYDTCKPCKSFNMGFGGFVGFSGQDFISGGSIMLTTNKKASYAVSVGYMFNESVTYKPNLAQFTIYWNIK